MPMLAVDLGADAEAIAVALIVALICAIAAGFGRLIVRLNRQDALMVANKETLQRLESELTRQFGPNSGGLREAVNSLKADRAADRVRMDEHLEAHSYNRRRDDP